MIENRSSRRQTLFNVDVYLRVLLNHLEASSFARAGVLAKRNGRTGSQERSGLENRQRRNGLIFVPFHKSACSKNEDTLKI